jgi:hypothetical protein
VAHCCLKSAAPSGGFAGGGEICAVANRAANIAPQIPSPISGAEILINVSVGAGQALGHCQQAVVVAGCFAEIKSRRGIKTSTRSPDAALQVSETSGGPVRQRQRRMPTAHSRR